MTTISKRPYFSSLVLCLLMFALVGVQFVAGLVPGPAAAQTPSYVRIKNKCQNTYLYQSSNQVRYGTPAASDTSSHWVLEAYAGSTRIKNRATGNYMAIENLQDYVEAIAIQDAWESARWTVSDAPTGGGYKIIRNVWNNWKVIHIENLRGYAQTGDIPTNWDSPQWLLEPVGGTTPTNTPVPPTSVPPTSVPPTSVPPTTGPTSTPQPTPVPGSNLALGKPITASSTVHTFVAANANDNNLTTYWEGAGGSYPNTLTVSLGANANLTSVVVKLNPDSAWSTRTQTIEVQGRSQSGTSFTTLKAAASYTFNPSSGNSVTIPLSGTVADVRLVITANSGAPAGQVAEFQIFGSMAPNPDLVVNNVTWTPSAPNETSTISLQATVQNIGTAGAGATTVNFSLGANANLTSVV
ncbi:MAG: discoidin domain-containing protein, partial [Chloroflexi bacterium]|nr:discoidin domain-containing protein [Chloroflexota bacterium]